MVLFIFQATAGSAFTDDDTDDKKGKVKGKILDNLSGQPMQFANIALYNSTDSTLINGTITAENGEFEMKGLSFGEYYMMVNFIGYGKTQVENISLNSDNSSFDSGEIELNPSTTELGSVDVVADKAPIEFKLDKKVVNVSQTLNAAGGSAVDALENTPSVEVDIEGNVSLRGSSNFTVLIDGRPSVLSGSDALRQIPSAAIENIEIITNPSAKYEPDGSAGIINLVMKKNSLNGLSGMINGSIGTGDKYRGDVTLNYRTEKFNFLAGADWRDETSYGEMEMERETYLNDTTDYLTMKGTRDYTRSGNKFKSGIEFFPSAKTTLSVSGEIGTSKSDREGDGRNMRYTNPPSEEIYSVTEEASIRENDFYTGRFSFQHKINEEGHKIDVMVNYSNETGSDIDEEDEILSDENFEKTDIYLDRIYSLETEDENEWRIQADYTNPFSKTGRIEAGVLSRLEDELEERTFQVFDPDQNEWIIDEDFTSSTDFRRDIHAAYATFNNSLKEIDFMLGIRGEITNREIKNTNLDENSSLQRFDLFPTVHLGYSLNEKNEFTGSYSRRINRPSGRDLDPNPSYYNRYAIRLGNPDLEPEYTDSYELGFMRRFGRSFLSFDLFHRVTHNTIDRVSELGDDGILYSQAQNFDKDFSTGTEIMGNINATKWLLLNASVSLYHYRIQGNLNENSVDRESTNWNSRVNLTFKFTENSRLQVISYYRSPSTSVQGETKSMFYSNLSYRHEFFKKKLTGTLSLQDPLGTAKYARENYGDNFSSSFQWTREPRVLMLTLNYKINNFKEDRNNRGGNGGGMNMGGEF